MVTTRQVEELKYLLKREVELLEDFAGDERRLQNAMMDREWGLLEELVSAMSEASEEILSVEQERHECFTRVQEEVGCDGDDGFYDVLAALGVDDRDELAEFYRRLKVAVMRVQALTGGIGTYVTSATSAIREVIDELYPQRKGRTYSHQGVHATPDDRAMVFDRHT